jgi:hypothetical protein
MKSLRPFSSGTPLSRFEIRYEREQFILTRLRACKATRNILYESGRFGQDYRVTQSHCLPQLT